MALAGWSCGARGPRRLLRLGSLIQGARPAPVALGTGAATPDAPLVLSPDDLSASRVARLRLVAAGNAPLATLSWKLPEDRGFPPFRSLKFPLVPDGHSHTYEVDLQHETYWNGRIEALRLAVTAGRTELSALTGEPPRDPYRSMSLRGDTRPTLPGLARISVRLPDDLAAGTWLETWVGLLPEVDKPGVHALFRIYREARGRRALWLEESLDGSPDGQSSGWHTLRGRLPDGGGRLDLEVTATRAGEAISPGVALWGDPLLVSPGRATGKNLVVILIDTLRADVLGAYGDRTGITPRLDAFAGQGIRFARMNAPSPWTLPSVSSLMTGLQPQTHGAGMRFGELAPTGLPASGVNTLASVLAKEGFYTLGVYHNIYVNPGFGLQQGFDEYSSREDKADVLVNEALERLRHTAPDRRFFLYLHLFDAHNPYEPPAEECREVARRLEPSYRGPLGCSGDRRPELPTPPEADRRWLAALYRAEVAYTDKQVGRFLDALRDMGLSDDTVVAVVSDHGEEFWTRFAREGQLGYQANSDHGHTLYEELLHVPALLRIPGHAPAVMAEPAELVDLFPTLLHAAGVAPPPSQGRDLLPLLDSHAAQQTTLIGDVILHGPLRWSVHRGPWKLIVPREAGLPVELYDLVRDPEERNDLSRREPRVVSELRAWGERELARRARERATFLPGSDSLSATYLEWNHITKLRALGYLR